jgi:hypothetical protein
MRKEIEKIQSFITNSITYVVFVTLILCIILSYYVYSLRQDVNLIKNTSFQITKSDGICIITDENNPIIIKEQDEKADSLIFGLILAIILVFVIFLYKFFKTTNKPSNNSYIYGPITAVIGSFILIRFLYEKPTSIKDFSFDFRGGIDEPTMILLGALISVLALWYKDKSINDIIDWILGETPKEDELDRKVELEEGKIDYLTNNEEAQKEYNKEYEKVFNSNISDMQILEIITKEIRDNLLETANKSKKEGENFPISISKLVIFLRDKNILSENFKDVLIKFYRLKSTYRHKNSLKRLIEIGSKIWRLIIEKKRDYYKKIEEIQKAAKESKENIKILPMQIKTEKENSILECEIKIKTGNDYINIEYLNRHDVRIEAIDVEKNGTKEKKTISIMPESVTYIEDEKVNLRLCLIIDDSRSMSMNGKSFDIVKQQACYILELLKNYENFNAEILVSKLLDSGNNEPISSWGNIDSSIKTIEALQLQGESGTNMYRTPLYYTINRCLEKMEGNESLYMMIVLSDGEDNEDTDRYYSEVKKKLLGGNSEGEENFLGRKCMIKVISYTGVCPNPDANSYKDARPNSDITKIVEMSGGGGEGIGYFVDVENEKLNSVFENIIQSVLKRYRIVWRSSTEKAEKIIITVAGIKQEEYL